MPSLARSRGSGLPWVILAGVASAALFYFGTGLQPIWWMVWSAPVPVLAIAPRLGRGAAFLLAAGAWFVGALNMWNYFTRVVEVPLPITLVALVVPALIFGLGVLLVRSFLRRGALPKAALAFPVFGYPSNTSPRWARRTAPLAISPIRR